MKKAIIIAVTMLGIVLTVFFNINKEENKITEVDRTLAKIELNHIAVSASEYDIDKVNFSRKIKQELPAYAKVYKVKTKRYNDKEIENIAKDGIKSAIKQRTEMDDTKFYELSNGGNITYYEKSGTISYNCSKEGNDKWSSNIISNSKLKEKAIEFIEKSNIININELEFYKANPSITAKTSDGEEIVEYEVIYTKIPPEGIDGFDGTGPGVAIQFDCDGNITGFVSIDKDIELTNLEYPAKNVDDIEQDIVNNNNVMIYSGQEIDNQVQLSNLECVLYCDSIQEEQEYMVTHYRLKDKNEEGIDIVLPALKNRYITIK